MTIHEFIARYSVAQRSLTAPCDGVVMHQLRVPSAPEDSRHFGAVVDGDRAWVVPFFTEAMAATFIYGAAGALYEAAADALQDVAA